MPLQTVAGGACQGVQESDLIDFTPELRAQALEIFKQYETGPIYTPPIIVKPGGPLGTLQIPAAQGAALWQGAAFDPETKLLYVPSVTNLSVAACSQAASGPTWISSEVEVKAAEDAAAEPARRSDPASPGDHGGSDLRGFRS
jgi:quinoprotein glucose dehydrogenase